MRNQALYRQWMILQKLQSYQNRGISKRELAEEFNVSKKTIERDITNLSSCGFPIYDKIDEYRECQVFYYMMPHYKFPGLVFNFQEYMTLLLIYKMSFPLESYLDGYIKDSFKKLQSQIPQEYSNFYKKMWNFILPDTSSYFEYDDLMLKNISDVVNALFNYKQVYVKYKSLISKQMKEHFLSPLCLKIYQNNVYLVAYSDKKKATLLFALNRIIEIEVLNTPPLQVKFNPDKFFENAFGNYKEKSYKVVLEFKSDIAPYIAERIWYRKQKLRVLDNKNLQMEIPNITISEIKKFVFSYGNLVKVIEPQELIDEVLDNLEKVKEYYS